MGATAVCQRWDGMGTIGQAMGRETVGNGTGSGVVNTRHGNEAPHGGIVDGGNTNQGRERPGNRGRERNIARFPVPVPVPCPSRPHFPVPTFTARARDNNQNMKYNRINQASGDVLDTKPR